MTLQKQSLDEYTEKLKVLPFRVLISFKKIFEYWEKVVNEPNNPLYLQAKQVLEQLEHVPELREPIADLDRISNYTEEIRLLMSCTFPEVLTDNEIKAISLPFLPAFFNPSRRFQKILKNAGEGFEMTVRDFNVDLVYKMAGQFLLQAKYGVQLMQYKQSMYFDIPDETTGAVNHYRAFFNGDFSDFTENENHRDLTPEEIQELIDNYDDIERWKELIPPQSFDFEGFAIVTLFDVTRDQALSELKERLLEKDVLHSFDRMKVLEEHVQDYLGIPDAHIGFAAYDHDAKKLSSLGVSNWSSFLLKDHHEIERRDGFCNHSIEKIFKQKERFVTSKISKEMKGRNPLLDILIEKKIKSVIVAPLSYGEEVIGFIELTSHKVGVLNSMVSDQLEHLLPLFTVALKRTMDDHETNLEAIVQEQFTTIHPSVSWKFFEAAEKILTAKREGRVVEPDPIVFHDVVPLFAQFDIRGSSQARNSAIQADLLEQLNLAMNVFQVAIDVENKPIYNHLNHRVQVYKDRLEDEIHAGDEVKILEFLRQEIYPVFKFMRTESEQMNAVIAEYDDALDPVLQVVYKKRKAYEETVTMLNEKISEYVEKQEEVAQKMYPHYFEKYKTDGVEYNIYIGESIMQAREYHPIHLQNLRLWQLLVSCGVERLVRSVEPLLPVDLKIASLILANDNPLSIKFRMDEKQFDVDGAYNIRYEIMKKRIDKAYIKGTNERLTQPGKLAIVYSQQSEAQEYRRYIEYLQSIGYLSLGIEDLTLQDLQGATGLKALRVNVLYSETEEAQIEELMKSSLLN